MKIDTSPMHIVSFEKRLDIARRLDVDAAMTLTPIVLFLGGFNDHGVWQGPRETVLAGMHKARVMGAKYFTKAERRLSREWLKANGWRVLGDN